MSKCAGLLFSLLLVTGSAFALDQSIPTSTAGGKRQTTIIDENGNLKVVDSQSTNATASQAAPTTQQTVTENTVQPNSLSTTSH